MKGRGGGEIVEVEGGHVLRSIGRKDRHSKVYTAKGPRDRRVRLAAHTAIQFYDVQDRLGYDRPSRAVDWLIKNAKNAIEKLDELPPWNPPIDCPLDHPGTSAVAFEEQPDSSSGYAFRLQKQLGIDSSGDSSFIPPPDETQCNSDAMKPFFPTSSGISLINFQNYPNNVLSSASIHTEDLGLSLQTLQAPNSTNQVHLSDSTPLTFDTNYPKGGDWSGDENELRMGVFNSQLITEQIQYCESSALHPRESLQSSFSHLFHAWENRSLQSDDHHHSAQATHDFSIPEIQVPASIEGEEDPGMVPFRQSSASPLSPY